MSVHVKSSRLNLRMSEDAAAAIRRGAASAGTTVSEFVVAAAVERAERELADRTRFVLDDDDWARFVALLDRPPRAVAELRELLRRDDLFARAPTRGLARWSRATGRADSTAARRSSTNGWRATRARPRPP